MRFLGMISFLAALPSLSVAENYSSILREMDNISAETVVVLPETRGGISEPLLWSEDGESLAVNFRGEWVQFIPRPPVRRTERWAGGEVGEYYSFQDITPMNSDEIHAMKSTTRLTGERQVTTDDGTVFEMITDNDSERNELVVFDEHGTVINTFSLGLNRCHSLSLAPEKHLIAYVCNGLGVLISKIDIHGTS